MRLGIFGGTFSPPHIGHISSAEKFILQCKLDKLLIIPAYIAPHKDRAEADIPQHRLNMARLAFAALGERAEVSDIEISRGGKSYTFDTLTALGEKDELFLLCGTDMIMNFESWYRFEEIFKMCTVAVCERYSPTSEENAALKVKTEYFKNRYGAKIMTLAGVSVPISSTAIREMIKNGEDVSAYVGDDVTEYIKEKELYR